MDGKKFIRTLHLRNFLSYGATGVDIELEPLNVLIGPNNSGKSNLLEVFRVLQAAPQDLAVPFRVGGGIGEWLWKGGAAGKDVVAQIEATVDYPAPAVMPLRYRLFLTSAAQRLWVVDEAIENVEPYPNRPPGSDVYFFYRYQKGHPSFNVRERPEAQAGSDTGRARRQLRHEDLSPEQSVLSQRKDPDLYPELTYLGEQFGKIKLYTDWTFGRQSPPRQPQLADLPVDRLLEDCRNLGLVLNHLQNFQTTKRSIEEHLRKFYGVADYINPRILGGTVQVFLVEKDLQQPVPATRLSDGTLRYLCLLTLLCNPDPPPLFCIEEPELGLHPDILPTIAELLIEASQRTQIIVTTHSDVLVSALTEVPEAVVVCERDESGTRLRRLEPARLKKWLEKYSLGELWRMGEIGGTRW